MRDTAWPLPKALTHGPKPMRMFSPQRAGVHLARGAVCLRLCASRTASFANPHMTRFTFSCVPRSFFYSMKQAQHFALAQYINAASLALPFSRRLGFYT